MKINDIFTHIGEYGRYHKQVSLVLCIVIIPCAFYNIGTVFFNGHMDHHCKIPALLVDSVDCSLFTDSCDVNLPPDDKDTLLINETQCRMYVTDELTSNVTNDNKELEGCEYGWVYDTSQYESTIVSEFDLVCEDSYRVSLAASLYLAGFFLGSLIFGWMSDRFGRKLAIFIALALTIVSGTLCAVATSYWFYIVCRLINGCTSIGIYLSVFVYVAEFVGPSKRAMMATIVTLYWSLGYMILAVFAYFIRSWRTLLLVLSLIPTPLLILYFFIPESARWLILHQRPDEAAVVLKKIANGNKKHDLPDDIFERLEVEDETKQKKGNVLDLMRYPRMRRNTFNLVFCWFTINIVYYGLSYGVEGLSLDVYIGTFLSGVTEICAYIFAWFIIQRFGRPWTLSGSLIAGGVMCFINIWISSDMEAIRTAVAMGGKFFITTAFAIVYIITVEIYPTNIRSTGLGLCSFMSRFAAVLAPQLLFLEKLWQYLPLVTYSSMSISAGLLALFLPETLNVPLPQSIEEAEVLRRKSKPRTNGMEFHDLNKDTPVDA